GVAEAVRAEDVVVARHPLADHVRHHVVPVARGDVRAAGVTQLGRDVGLAVVAARLEQPLALDLEGLAAQLAPARHRPHAGAHAPVLGEDLAGVHRPRDTHPGRQELDTRTVTPGGEALADAPSSAHAID